MTDFKRRFDEEMRHLLGSGREFAQASPSLAQALSIDDVTRRHPYLERLFENFAFLAARTRSDLEDAEDETAAEILDLVAHGMETPLPAVAMVEFLPTAETAGLSAEVAPGAEVRGWASGHPTQLRTSVPSAVLLHHLRVESAKLSAEAGGHSSLEFVLASTAQVGSASWPRSMDIFLGEDPAISWTLRHFLLRKVESVEVEPREPGAEVRFSAASAGGYSRSASPRAASLLDLRDLLCVEDRFRYVRLEGLGRAVRAGAESVRIRVRFRGILPHDMESRVDKKCFRLNSGPVVNAYPEDFQPLALEPSRSSYPLAVRDESAKEVLDLARVEGHSQSDPARTHPYVFSWELRHAGLRVPSQGAVLVHRHPNRAGGTRLTFSVSSRDKAFFFPDEFLSGTVWCCDGDVLAERMRPQDLDEPGPGLPSGLQVRGLTRPTQAYRPPTDPGYRWRILSHFQKSFGDFARVESLKDTLRALLWDPRGARRPLVDGIRGLEASVGHMLLDSVPRPFWDVRIAWEGPDVAADSWEALGRLDAFAACLWRLLSERSPAGMETRLSLRVEPAGVVLEHGW